MKGYVYIISNPAMPGIFKIGFTRKNPELRAKEFDSTGVPHPYVVEYEILVDEPHALEQRVHKSLRAQREGKEWFRCSFTQAVQGIRACYQGKIYREKCFKTEREKELERVRQEQILRDLEQKKKRKLIVISVRICNVMALPCFSSLFMCDIVPAKKMQQYT